MGNIILRKALNAYKTIYMPYRNLAERTRVEYLNDLEDFLGFLGKTGINHVKEIGLRIIELYVANLERKGLASLTRKRRVVTIRSFLSYLYDDGCLDTNISKKIVLPFTESTTPYVLTQSQCDRLRNASADSPRDNAIIELFLQTGITLSELVHLTLNDIKLDETEKHQGFMRILGSRGNKERIIPLNSKASVALKNYIGTRKDTGNSILFLNRFGEPLGERGNRKCSENT
jgi:site-specific recombinase XerD